MTLDSLKDEYAGERIFVVGNGPSLSETPLERLDSEYSIGINSVNKIYSETSWRPYFYYAHEHVVADIEDDIKINTKECELCFLDSELPDELTEQEEVYTFNRVRANSPREYESRDGEPLNLDENEVEDMSDNELRKYWSDDITEIVYTYHSMYPVLQIVDYLGFDEIYFIGCDLGLGYHAPHLIFESGLDPHNYEGSNLSYLIDTVRSGAVVASIVNGLMYKFIYSTINPQPLLSKISDNAADDNHFGSEYFTKPRDMRKHNNHIIETHKIARRMMVPKGTELYNATIGGELEVHPRVDIESLV